jgi:hypothetical protein
MEVVPNSVFTILLLGREIPGYEETSVIEMDPFINTKTNFTFKGMWRTLQYTVETDWVGDEPDSDTVTTKVVEVKTFIS